MRTVPMLQKLALAIGLFLFAVTSLIVGADDVGELVLGLVLCAVLVTVALTDLQRRVIPNATVLAGSVAAIAIAMVSDPGSLPDRALAALVAGGVLFALALAYPRGMGMGDAKLLAMMGLYLGRAVAPAVVIAS
ncbi:MAG TPA: A24 family peptidase [Solirubrobacterales bacterium]|nr:A24 family peptidase [Solirubrobacterales bacterium]